MLYPLSFCQSFSMQPNGICNRCIWYSQVSYFKTLFFACIPLMWNFDLNNEEYYTQDKFPFSHFYCHKVTCSQGSSFNDILLIWLISCYPGCYHFTNWYSITNGGRFMLDWIGNQIIYSALLLKYQLQTAVQLLCKPWYPKLVVPMCSKLCVQALRLPKKLLRSYVSQIQDRRSPYQIQFWPHTPLLAMQFSL